LTKIALYSNQPFLSAGLQSVLLTQQDLTVSLSCGDLEGFVAGLQDGSHDVLLIEVTPEITVEAVGQLKLAARRAAMILWTETISTDLASMMIDVGVRGILRKSLPTELLIKCLRKVAGGELWLEKSLSNRLLLSERLNLTPREQQIIGLLPQGMKNKELAYAIGVTEGTVKVYLSRLFAKVGVQSRFELALLAIKKNCAIDAPKAA
jgi:two-component system nitrate/nitrite response regulator NarL